MRNRNTLLFVLSMCLLLSFAPHANAYQTRSNLFVAGAGDLYEVAIESGSVTTDHGVFPDAYMLNGGGGMYLDGYYLVISSWGDSKIKRYLTTTGDRNENFIISGGSASQTMRAPRGIGKLSNGVVVFTSVDSQDPLGQDGKLMNWYPGWPGPSDLASVARGGNGGLKNPTGLAISKSDIIYVGHHYYNNTSGYDDCVKMFAKNGGYAGEIARNPQIRNPQAIYINPADDVIYISGTDTSNRGVVVRYNKDNSFRDVFILGSTTDTFGGMTFGPDGNFYVGHRQESAGSIRVYTNTGTFIRNLTTATFGQLPTALVFAPVSVSVAGETLPASSSPPIGYSGSWTTFSDWSTMRAFPASSQAALRFSGSTPYLDYCGDSASGTGTSKIDSVSAGTINFNSSSPACNRTKIGAGGLASGVMHTVKINPSGNGHIDVKGFAITTP